MFSKELDLVMTMILVMLKAGQVEQVIQILEKAQDDD